MDHGIGRSVIGFVAVFVTHYFVFSVCSHRRWHAKNIEGATVVHFVRRMRGNLVAHGGEVWGSPEDQKVWGNVVCSLCEVWGEAPAAYCLLLWTNKTQSVTQNAW